MIEVIRFNYLHRDLGNWKKHNTINAFLKIVNTLLSLKKIYERSKFRTCPAPPLSAPC